MVHRELADGLEEPVASIIWATPRLLSEAQELAKITEQLTAKYGKEFAQSCRANALGIVNEKLVHKLSVQAPPKILIEKYLEEIAKTYNIAYVPDPCAVDSMPTDLLFDNMNSNRGGGGSGGGGGGGSGGGRVHQSLPSVPFTYPPQQASVF